MKEEKIGPGMTIAGFESAEEMVAYMAKQEADAIKLALDEQWAITWGDYVFRMVDELAIWGYIFTEREFLANNSKKGQGPSEEILEELDQLKESHTRGYRYGRWFSEVLPKGELGSAHVSALWKIDKSDFEAARRNEWLVLPQLAAKILIEMREARTNHERKEGKTHADSEEGQGEGR